MVLGASLRDCITKFSQLSLLISAKGGKPPFLLQDTNGSSMKYFLYLFLAYSSFALSNPCNESISKINKFQLSNFKVDKKLQIFVDDVKKLSYQESLTHENAKTTYRKREVIFDSGDYDLTMESKEPFFFDTIDCSMIEVADNHMILRYNIDKKEHSVKFQMNTGQSSLTPVHAEISGRMKIIFFSWDILIKTHYFNFSTI